MRRSILGLALTACAPRAAMPTVTATAGLELAVYARGDAGFTIVDDRRLVQLRGGTVVLDGLDPAAALSSLLIEPLAGSDLVPATCARAALADAGAPLRTAVAAPPVRCTATGQAGGHRVRILYVAPSRRFVAQHAITVGAPDRATVATRLVLQTPALGRSAHVVLYRGLPGDGAAPVEVARGPMQLDGAVALFDASPRDVAARIRRTWTLAPAAADAAGTNEAAQRARRDGDIQVWLELDTELAAGATRVTLELAGELPGEVASPVAAVTLAPGRTRIPLPVDPDLHGTAERRVLRGSAAGPRELFTLVVANRGSAVREVEVVAPLASGMHTVEAAWPASPVLHDSQARATITVAPTSVARLRFTIATTMDP